MFKTILEKLQRSTSDILVVISDQEEEFRKKFFSECDEFPYGQKCTICSKEPNSGIYPHPALRVTVCFTCYNRYEDTLFLTNKDGTDTLCRWCAKRTETYSCCECTCVFCKDCLDRNFGQDYVRNMIEDSSDWCCLICNPKQLWGLRAFCTRAMDANRNIISASTPSTSKQIFDLHEADEEGYQSSSPQTNYTEQSTEDIVTVRKKIVKPIVETEEEDEELPASQSRSVAVLQNERMELSQNSDCTVQLSQNTNSTCSQTVELTNDGDSETNKSSETAAYEMFTDIHNYVDSFIHLFHKESKLFKKKAFTQENCASFEDVEKIVSKVYLFCGQAKKNLSYIEGNARSMFENWSKKYHTSISDDGISSSLEENVSLGCSPLKESPKSSKKCGSPEKDRYLNDSFESKTSSKSHKSMPTPSTSGVKTKCTKKITLSLKHDRKLPNNSATDSEDSENKDKHSALLSTRTENIVGAIDTNQHTRLPELRLQLEDIMRKTPEKPLEKNTDLDSSNLDNIASLETGAEEQNADNSDMESCSAFSQDTYILNEGDNIDKQKKRRKRKEAELKIKEEVEEPVETEGISSTNLIPNNDADQMKCNNLLVSNNNLIKRIQNDFNIDLNEIGINMVDVDNDLDSSLENRVRIVHYLCEKTGDFIECYTNYDEDDEEICYTEMNSEEENSGDKINLSNNVDASCVTENEITENPQQECMLNNVDASCVTENEITENPEQECLSNNVDASCVTENEITENPEQECLSNNVDASCVIENEITENPEQECNNAIESETANDGDKSVNEDGDVFDMPTQQLIQVDYADTNETNETKEQSEIIENPINISDRVEDNTETETSSEVKSGQNDDNNMEKSDDNTVYDQMTQSIIEYNFENAPNDDMENPFMKIISVCSIAEDNVADNIIVENMNEEENNVETVSVDGKNDQNVDNSINADTNNLNDTENKNDIGSVKKEVLSDHCDSTTEEEDGDINEDANDLEYERISAYKSLMSDTDDSFIGSEPCSDESSDSDEAPTTSALPAIEETLGLVRHLNLEKVLENLFPVVISDKETLHNSTQNSAEHTNLGRVLDSELDNIFSESVKRLSDKDESPTSSELEASAATELISEADCTGYIRELNIESELKNIRGNNNSDTDDDLIAQHFIKDPKLLQKCSVVIERVDFEKCFGLVKVSDTVRYRLDSDKEDDEIRRLTNLATLKRCSRARLSSDSSNESLKKRKKRKKSNNKSDASSSSDSDDSLDDLLSLDVDLDERSDISKSLSRDDLSPGFLDDLLLNTDSEFDGYSDKDEEEDEEDISAKPKRKKSVQSNEDEDPAEKTNTDENNEVEQPKSQAKPADDGKSNWRKDKLLTSNMNLSDSDATDDSTANEVLRRRNDRLSTNSDGIPEEEDVKLDFDNFGEHTIVLDASSADSSSEMDDDCVFVDIRKKRRFIDSSSDEDESKPSKKGRKNIKEVMSDDLLQEETKLADKEEEERKERISMKHKSLDFVLSQTSMSQDEVGLVLDVDEIRQEPVVSVHPALTNKLKRHQCDGIKFMWDVCFESVSQLQRTNGAGCILAHCMGLGKTMQIVVLSHALLTHPVTQVKHILVVCPLSTVFNWKNEFTQSMALVRNKIKVYDIRPGTHNTARKKIFTVQTWRRLGGVLLIGYESFQTLVLVKKTSSIPDQYREELLKALVDPGPDLLVCDEGHMLKNDKTIRFQSLVNLKTKRRIILTGTPLQNNLNEYYYMVQMVKPHLLGTITEYANRFVNPIMNGQYEDSDAYDINLMRKRSHVLHKKLETTVQRFEVSELTQYLPKKFDYVLFVTLSPLQIKLYQTYLGIVDSNRSLFRNFHALQNIWTHPALLQLRLNKTKPKKVKTYDEDFVAELDADSVSDEIIDNDWFKPDCPDDLMTNIEHGSKIHVLFSIIDECQSIGDKLLVFSSRIDELDLIEYFLKQNLSKTWVNGVDYFRMDGTVRPEVRMQYCNKFNDTKNRKAMLFLVSHKVGGLGLNLVAANRVVLMDVNWNPAFDIQSVFRVYRFGQEKECFIYRLVSMGTMEEVVYGRGVTKLAISGRVVDERQINRHFKSVDLHQMYQLNIETKEPPTPTLPSDRLLAKLWDLHNPVLYKFYDHESMLRNLPDEQLNDEEMKLAWEEFHNEEEAQRRQANLVQQQRVDLMQTYSNVFPIPGSSGINYLPRPFPRQYPKPQSSSIQPQSTLPTGNNASKDIQYIQLGALINSAKGLPNVTVLNGHPNIQRSISQISTVRAQNQSGDNQQNIANHTQSNLGSNPENNPIRSPNISGTNLQTGMNQPQNVPTQFQKKPDNNSENIPKDYQTVYEKNLEDINNSFSENQYQVGLQILKKAGEDMKLKPQNFQGNIPLTIARNIPQNIQRFKPSNAQTNIPQNEQRNNNPQTIHKFKPPNTQRTRQFPASTRFMQISNNTISSSIPPAHSNSVRPPSHPFSTTPSRQTPPPAHRATNNVSLPSHAYIPQRHTATLPIAPTTSQPNNRNGTNFSNTPNIISTPPEQNADNVVNPLALQVRNQNGDPPGSSTVASKISPTVNNNNTQNMPMLNRRLSAPEQYKVPSQPGTSNAVNSSLASKAKNQTNGELQSVHNVNSPAINLTSNSGRNTTSVAQKENLIANVMEYVNNLFEKHNDASGNAAPMSDPLNIDNVTTLADTTNHNSENFQYVQQNGNSQRCPENPRRNSTTLHPMLNSNPGFDISELE